MRCLCDNRHIDDERTFYFMQHMQQLTKQHVALLQQIGRETFYDTFHAHNDVETMNHYLATAFALDKLTAELENEQSFFYVLFDENDAAGYMKLNVGDAQSEPFGHETLEVERIYIRKQYKRRGFGNVLMQRAIQMARSLEKKAIWLGVWSENTQALAFYETHGFVKHGEHTFMMGDEAQIDYVMRKEL